MEKIKNKIRFLEISLFDAFWERKRFVFFFTAISTIAGIVIILTSPKIYRTQAILHVAPPKLSPVKLPRLTLDNWRQIGLSLSILDKVIQGLELKDANDLSLPSESLRDTVSIDLLQPKVFWEHAEGLIGLQVEGRDPKLIANIANTWADIMTEEITALYLNDARTADENFKEQLKANQEKMDSVETNLKKLVETPNFKSMARELKLKEDKLHQYRSALLDLNFGLPEIQFWPNPSRNFIPYTKNPEPPEARAKIIDLYQKGIAALAKDISTLDEKIESEKHQQKILEKELQLLKGRKSMLLNKMENNDLILLQKTISQRHKISAVAPRIPVKPRKLAILSISGLGGLAISLVLCFLKELVDILGTRKEQKAA